MRDDLNGSAKEVSFALLVEDRLVDRARSDAAVTGERLVDEPLVMAEIEVGLSTVIGDEDLTVLEGAHRTRVDVQVGVELLDGHLESASLEQAAKRCGRDALAEPRYHASGHEDVLCHTRCPSPLARERPNPTLPP